MKYSKILCMFLMLLFKNILNVVAVSPYNNIMGVAHRNQLDTSSVMSAYRKSIQGTDLQFKREVGELVFLRQNYLYN